MLYTSRPRCASPGIPAAAITVLLLQILTLSCSRSLTAMTAPAVTQARVTGTTRAIRGIDPLPDDPSQAVVVVTLAPGVDASDVAASYSASVVRQVVDARTAELVPPAGLSAANLEQQLSTDTRVVSAEPNEWLETAEARQQSFAFDDGFGSSQTYTDQPAAEAVELGEAHLAATGRGVTVAILDTGIDPNHPELRSSYAGGVDFVGDDLDPTEERQVLDDDLDGHVDEAYGHGTHVAGIVHLVAPEARLLAVRVLDSDGRGSLLDVVAGVRWAMAHGAKVINLSLGSLTRSVALQHALADARDMGIAVVVAAGNWATTSRWSSPPACPTSRRSRRWTRPTNPRTSAATAATWPWPHPASRCSAPTPGASTACGAGRRCRRRSWPAPARSWPRSIPSGRSARCSIASPKRRSPCPRRAASSTARARWTSAPRSRRTCA